MALLLHNHHSVLRYLIMFFCGMVWYGANPSQTNAQTFTIPIPPINIFPTATPSPTPRPTFTPTVFATPTPTSPIIPTATFIPTNTPTLTLYPTILPTRTPTPPPTTTPTLTTAPTNVPPSSAPTPTATISPVTPTACKTQPVRAPRITQFETTQDSVTFRFDPYGATYEAVDIQIGPNKETLDREILGVGRSTTRRITVSLLQANTDYSFRIRLATTCGSGEWSEIVTTKTIGGPTPTQEAGSVAGEFEAVTPLPSPTTVSAEPTARLRPSQITEYDVTVKIQDQSGKALQNVSASVVGATRAVSTNDLGVARIGELSKGEYELQLSGPTISATYDLSVDGPSRQLFVTLTVEPEPLWWQQPHIWFSGFLATLGIGLIVDGFLRSIRSRRSAPAVSGA